MNTNNITINTQSSIRIESNKIIYFDPYKIDNKLSDANIIFITHDHYDHFDINSINNIKNNDTIVVAPKMMKDVIENIKFKEYIYLDPNEEIKLDDINIKTIPSYNINKPFHPRSSNYLGYIITSNNITYYIAGDSDNTLEARSVKCDIALVPIGGKFTMDVMEASELIKIINPKVVIPTHYGSIVGNISDAKVLKDNLSNTNINVVEKIIK